MLKMDRINERVNELLKTPYAGSKTIVKSHHSSKYLSNCHGTMAYVFGLNDLKEPDFIYADSMEELIEKYFVPSDNSVGDLITFYGLLFNGYSLIHTARLVGDGKIFHQAGSGKKFEKVTIEKEKKILTKIVMGTNIDVRSYRLK